MVYSFQNTESESETIMNLSPSSLDLMKSSARYTTFASAVKIENHQECALYQSGCPKPTFVSSFDRSVYIFL